MTAMVEKDLPFSIGMNSAICVIFLLGFRIFYRKITRLTFFYPVFLYNTGMAEKESETRIPLSAITSLVTVGLLLVFLFAFLLIYP